MMIIEFVFAFVSLIVMCCAFNERMLRDRAAGKQVKEDEILTSEQQFHALVSTINAQIELGLFGTARHTCLQAFQTLISARLNRKTVTDQLHTDLRSLSQYIHELDYELEALPLFQKAKDALKAMLDDNHIATQYVKTQTRQLHNLTSDRAELTWQEAAVGSKIGELIPLLCGEGWYTALRGLASSAKKTCRVAEPCYAVRTARKR